MKSHAEARMAPPNRGATRSFRPAHRQRDDGFTYAKRPKPDTGIRKTVRLSASAAILADMSTANPDERFALAEYPALAQLLDRFVPEPG
jgi:hypothetical protein